MIRNDISTFLKIKNQDGHHIAIFGIEKSTDSISDYPDELIVP